MSVVATEHLTVRFRKNRREKITALDDVNLDIPKGEFFALLGENGAGKSTTMHCMLGVTRPAAGLVKLLGEQPVLGGAMFDRVGYLPEEPHWYPAYLTIEEAIRYYARLFRRPVPVDRAMALLDRLGLGPYTGLRIGKCSKGMKQKVGIAQCLLNEPEVLFLDEPMRGLDPVGVRDFRDVLVEMNRNGATIVMNSHILAEVQTVATTVAILRRGKLVLQQKVADLAQTDRDHYDIALEAEDPLPDFITNIRREGRLVRGVIPVARLQELIAITADGRMRLESCDLRKPSLEESFFAVLGREEAHA